MFTRPSHLHFLASWWQRLVEIRRHEAIFARLPARSEPLMTERESEVRRIKARIIARLTSRRFEACALELSSLAPRNVIVFALPGFQPPGQSASMKEHNGTIIQEPEPQPGFSPKPDPAESPFWSNDPDSSPPYSPSPSPSPRP